MLVLSRKLGEQIRIGDDIVVTVVRIAGDKVKLGVTAPRETPVHRGEVYGREKQRLVTVCAGCLMASCWHGRFMCDESDLVGTVEKTVAELDALGREHPDQYT